MPQINAWMDERPAPRVSHKHPARVSGTVGATQVGVNAGGDMRGFQEKGP